jgi:excisionase family DNA binding protein
MTPNQANITGGPSNPWEALLIGFRQVLREELQVMLKPNSRTGTSAQPRRGNKPYLSVKEAAKMATLAPSTIRLYIRKGKLKAHKVGRRVLIAKTDLEDFLTVNPVYRTRSRLLT